MVIAKRLQLGMFRCQTAAAGIDNPGCVKWKCFFFLESLHHEPSSLDLSIIVGVNRGLEVLFYRR